MTPFPFINFLFLTSLERILNQLQSLLVSQIQILSEFMNYRRSFYQNESMCDRLINDGTFLACSTFSAKCKFIAQVDDRQICDFKVRLRLRACNIFMSQLAPIYGIYIQSFPRKFSNLSQNSVSFFRNCCQRWWWLLCQIGKTSRANSIYHASRGVIWVPSIRPQIGQKKLRQLKGQIILKSRLARRRFS